MVTITMGQHTLSLDGIRERIRDCFSHLFPWILTGVESVLKEIIKMGLTILLSSSRVLFGIQSSCGLYLDYMLLIHTLNESETIRQQVHFFHLKTKTKNLHLPCPAGSSQLDNGGHTPIKMEGILTVEIYQQAVLLK